MKEATGIEVLDPLEVAQQVAHHAAHRMQRRAVVRLAHHGAEARTAFDQAATGKGGDGFADHRPAGAELLHQVALGRQRFRIGERAGDDLLL